MRRVWPGAASAHLARGARCRLQGLHTSCAGVARVRAVASRACSTAAAAPPAVEAESSVLGFEDERDVEVVRLDVGGSKWAEGMPDFLDHAGEYP